MTGSLRLILFDVDGTLIDSQDVIVACMRAAFDGVSKPAPDRTRILSIVGLSLDVAVAELSPDSSAAEVSRIADLYRDAFVQHRETGASVPLFKGARQILERLHAQDDTLLGVATGKARRGLDHVYDTLQIGTFFVTHQTADLHPSKPHPAMIEAALAETGVPAARAVMIGDTSFDIDMGRAAGVATIGVSWGYHPVDRLRAAGADHIVDDFAALEVALDDLGRAP